MTATIGELAPWSTADEPTRRHLALVRARWDLRMATEALRLAERFRRETLERVAAGTSAEDELIQCQTLVEQCREDAQAAVAVAQEVTDLVLREEAADTHTAFVAGVAHAHQA